MTTQPALDTHKTEAFLGKAIGDAGGMTTTIFAAIGDRLGLFKSLALGPATSTQLAARAHINERYAREWLGAMASAGYIEYDAVSHSFTLPPEYVPILAQENGPIFLGGLQQMLLGMAGPIDTLAQAFQQGGGVAQANYDENVWDGMERFTNGWYENMVVQQWLPTMPDVQERLERGVSVADIGCGRGRGIIKLAQAFPRSRYVGYDVFQPSIDRANANAQAAGVADRVRFQHLDASNGLPEQYDLITTFDVIHDAADPHGVLQSIRKGLRPDGRYFCLEMNGAETVEGNAGPIGTLLYGFSILYCMTTSLHDHGEGLGTVGLPESKVREMCREAGFSSVQRAQIENPFNSFFVATP
jgi:SAM-dependent methyltransferase